MSESPICITCGGPVVRGHHRTRYGYGGPSHESAADCVDHVRSLLTAAEAALERMRDSLRAAEKRELAALAELDEARAALATARSEALREAAGVCETEAQSLRSNGRHHAKSGDKQNAYDCIVEAQAIEAVRESILALLGEGVGS